MLKVNQLLPMQQIYTKQLVIHLKKWKLYSVKTKALNYTAETIQNTQFLMI
ncbi:hypothetical protein [Salmonella phage SD-1_S14]|nr:hypothetical protein [Salmonella phage SD-1_S14]